MNATPHNVDFQECINVLPENSNVGDSMHFVCVCMKWIYSLWSLSNEVEIFACSPILHSVTMTSIPFFSLFEVTSMNY